MRTLVMAGVLAAAFVGAAQAHDISYTVAPFSQSFNGGTGVSGGSFFSLLGFTSGTLNLTPGVSQTAFLDHSAGGGANNATGIHTGTATSDVTINGVTHPVSDDFIFNSGDLNVLLSGGPAVVFDLGTFEVTVTPVSSQFVREATFLETPLAAVPEPASLSLFGIGLAGLGIVLRRRRNRAIGA